MARVLTRIGQSIRWRLGMPVAAAELEKGTDESVAGFYNSRITECEFLDDPDHYEYPRASWVLEEISGGTLLEIGCGNGGMTQLMAPKVDRLTAFDVSAPSLAMVQALGLPNVETAQGLIENYSPAERFDTVVLSEVIEHLRRPGDAVCRAYEWLAPGGVMLITTPNGHWESDEHLHEFSMASFASTLAATGCETLEVAYLRDRDNRRRWLTARLHKPMEPDAPNDFFDRRSTARKRRSGA
jgi:2-polyprenyl-3-methyl-5-hydroxy-6-metoxy-1,4-benzoquinol methylase